MRYPRDQAPDPGSATILAAWHAMQVADRGDQHETDAHLAAFLCAAWPTEQAQSQ